MALVHGVEERGGRLSREPANLFFVFLGGWAEELLIVLPIILGLVTADYPLIRLEDPKT